MNFEPLNLNFFDNDVYNVHFDDVFINVNYLPFESHIDIVFPDDLINVENHNGQIIPFDHINHKNTKIMCTSNKIKIDDTSYVFLNKYNLLNMMVGHVFIHKYNLLKMMDSMASLSFLS